jgi:hypothetical protein
MKLLATGLTALLAVGVVDLASAACPAGGGNDETSENYTAGGGNWAVAAATPGTVAGGLVSNDLLITELAFTNNNQEFVEIYNPTAAPINLDNYYLSDDQFATGPTGYWRVVLGGGYAIGTTVDFNAKWPANTFIQPGQVMVIYMGAAAGAAFALGTADYEVASSTATPDMIAIGNVPSPANGLVTNGGEMVMLYKWDGACDLVCDVDYIAWGTTVSLSTRNDKTGISIDGIDGDAVPSAYFNDTPIATQGAGQSHTGGNSIQRVAVGSHAANGNGCLALVVPTKPSTWSNIKSHYNNR